MKAIITENQLKTLVKNITEQTTDMTASHPNLNKFLKLLSLKDTEKDGASVITGDTRLIHPLGGNYNVGGKFGDPRQNGARKHNGVDFPAQTGTPVYAPADGTVLEANDVGGNCGGFIKIDHTDLITKYCHLFSWVVRKGDKVKQGQRIGSVGGGKTDPHRGSSTGSHLHYEILNKSMVAINPQQSQYGIG